MPASVLLSQASAAQNLIRLWNVSNVERADLKLYYLLIEAKERKLCLSLAMKNKEELYGWQESAARSWETPEHELDAQGSPCKLSSHLERFHGETPNQMEISVYATHLYILHSTFLSHIRI
jgi:hypothetical protein